MPYEVNVSAGAEEYVAGLVTEKNGKDISGDAFDIGLGGWAPTTRPTEWTDGVVVGTGSVVTVKLFIDSSVPLGSYSLWIRVHDAPETVPRSFDRVDVV